MAQEVESEPFAVCAATGMVHADPQRVPSDLLEACGELEAGGLLEAGVGGLA